MTPQTIILPSDVTISEPSRYLVLYKLEIVNNHWGLPMGDTLLLKQSHVKDSETLVLQGFTSSRIRAFL